MTGEYDGPALLCRPRREDISPPGPGAEPGYAQDCHRLRYHQRGGVHREDPAGIRDEAAQAAKGLKRKLNKERRRSGELNGLI